MMSDECPDCHGLGHLCCSCRSPVGDDGYCEECCAADADACDTCGGSGEISMTVGVELPTAQREADGAGWGGGPALAAAEAAGRVVLLKAPPELEPTREPYSRPVMRLAHSTIWSRPIGHGRFFALQSRGGRYLPVVVDSEGIHELDVGTAPSWCWNMSADAHTLLLAHGKRAYRVQLRGGPVVEKLSRQPGKVGEVVDLGDRLVVVEQVVDGQTVLDVLVKKGSRWRRSARVPCRGFEFLCAVPERKLLVVTEGDSAGPRPTLLLAVAEDGMRLLGSSALPVRKLYVRDGEVVLLSRIDDDLLEEFETDGRNLELVTRKCDVVLVANLDAAVDKALQGPPAEDLMGASGVEELGVDGA